MSKLNSNYELISNKASNPVTTTPYIKHGEKWLDEMLNESDGRIDSVESGVAANTEAISQNTTNISTNTTNISGLDTRVTALEQGGGGGGGDNVGRIDRTEGATQHGEIFNMYTNDGDNKANRATGYMSHAEGVSTQASGACSHAEGSSTTASGSCSHAEGASTTAFGSYSHAEGFNTQATASGSHAEGNGARAFKEAAHAEGVQTTADGLYAHAEGNYTTASAEAAHAEGKNSIASGLYSHAEGEYTYAEEWGAHSEGKNTTASGKYSHAENSYSEALGENSHAEGNYTISSGYRTHTEGFHTKASGDNAHAEGYYTKASSNNQHVSGTANIEDKANKYAVIVGNGLWEGNESNAYTLDWQGNAWYAGDVTGNKDGEEYKLSDMKDKYTFPEGGIPASDLAEGVLPTVTDEYNPEGTAAVSGKAVAAAISAIPTPMQFKGTLGTGGTKTSLPTAEASNEGHTYRVITTGTYASQAAKVGDVFVSNGSAWIHIPAGDDAANSIVMTNYTSDKSSAGTSAIANTDTVTKAIGKVDNRLGNAETEIEKKVQKTSVSSANKTTSTIAITDNSQMVMVAKISGKTVKDGTTLKSAAVESVVSTVTGNANIIDYRVSGNIINTPTTSTNRSMANPVICVNHEFKYKAISKSGLTLDTVVVGYDGTGTKTLDSNWTGKSENTYTLSDDIKYVSLTVRYSNNAATIPGDISVEWNQLKTTVLVPSEARNCVGYGLGISDSVCNIADFENGVYTQKVNEVDLGNVAWYSSEKFVYSDLLDSKTGSALALCGKYTYQTDWNTFAATNNSFYIGVSGTKKIFINDSNLNNKPSATIKEALKGVSAVYELDVVKTTPLKDFIRPLPVENGGTLTLVNPHNLDVNSTIKYKKEI